MGGLLLLLSWSVNVYIAGSELEAARLGEMQKLRNQWNDTTRETANEGSYRLLQTVPSGARVQGGESALVKGAPVFTPTLVKESAGPLTLSTTFRKISVKSPDFNQATPLPLRPVWLFACYLFLPGLLVLALSYHAGRRRDETIRVQPTSRSFLAAPDSHFLEPEQSTGFEHALDTPDELIYGRYVKGELVGKGAMGEVFRCRSCRPDDHRDYALKILLGEWSRSQDFRARFEREADICGRLVHPNLVRAYDRGSKGEELWMVMEFLEGYELQEWLERTAPSQLQIVDLFLGLCDGLSHAHEQGVVHRDLKPENVLVSGNRGVITDFGLARGKQYATITKTNTAMGTPIYMPPEQITGGHGSPQGDVYSLGCVLYLCLAGRVPFTEPDVLSLLTQKLNGVPPPPLDPDKVPPALSHIVQKMMEAGPLERFYSAAEVKAALQEFRSSIT